MRQPRRPAVPQADIDVHKLSAPNFDAPMSCQTPAGTNVGFASARPAGPASGRMDCCTCIVECVRQAIAAAPLHPEPQELLREKHRHTHVRTATPWGPRPCSSATIHAGSSLQQQVKSATLVRTQCRERNSPTPESALGKALQAPHHSLAGKRFSSNRSTMADSRATCVTATWEPSALRARLIALVQQRTDALRSRVRQRYRRLAQPGCCPGNCGGERCQRGLDHAPRAGVWNATSLQAQARSHTTPIYSTDEHTVSAGLALEVAPVQLAAASTST